MMRITLSIILSLLFGACSTVNEFQVSRVGEEPSKYLERSIYVLPRTSFILTLTIEKETLIPGPYRLYTERFLGIEGGIEEPGVNYRITGVDVDAVLEPDPNHFYSINTIKGSISADEFLRLTEAGHVLRTDRLYALNPDAVEVEEDMEFPWFTDLSVKRHLQEVTDTMYKTVITDSSYVRIPVLRKQRDAKTLEQKAEEAANFIIKTRKRRFKLLAGQYELFPEGDALAISVKELNKTEKEYLELFLGKRVKEVYQRRYILTPTADSNEQIMPVARFSDQSGLHDKDSNTGSLIELSLAPMGNLRELRNLNMNYPNPELKNNLYYRIPDQADINVSISGEELLNQRFSVYQIGTLVNMPVIP